MSEISFANLICSKVRAVVGNNGMKYNKETSQLCQKAIAEGITEYLVSNVKVQVSYAGKMNVSPHADDPVVSDIMGITGECKVPNTPRMFELWVRELQANIADGFSVTMPGKNGVRTVFKPFNSAVGSLTISRNDLRIVHENNKRAPMQKTWEVICKGIMDWINSTASMNPEAIKVVATRDESTGTADLTKNTIV